MQSLTQQYGGSGGGSTSSVNSVNSTVAPPSSEYMFHTFDLKPSPAKSSSASKSDVTVTSSTRAASPAPRVTSSSQDAVTSSTSNQLKQKQEEHVSFNDSSPARKYLALKRVLFLKAIGVWVIRATVLFLFTIKEAVRFAQGTQDLSKVLVTSCVNRTESLARNRIFGKTWQDFSGVALHENFCKKKSCGKRTAN